MIDQTISLIQTATGCTSEEATEAVQRLIAAGWAHRSVPADPQEPAGPDVPATVPEGSFVVATGSTLVAHTDGACSGNPGPGGWAVVFSQDGVVVGERSGGVPDATNNRMELVAIREALRKAPDGVKLEIFTDSKNAIGWLTGGWKRNDIGIAATCREIDTLLAGRNCAFTYVKGHKGDKLNTRADLLAVAAVPKK